MRVKKGKFIDELHDKIFKTKGARFNAYERLKKKNRLSFYTRTLLTSYLIIVNLLNAFNPFQFNINSKIVSFYLISLSIILLIFIILESVMEYNLKAEKFHDCAKKLSRLFNKLQYMMDEENLSKKKVEDITNDYMDIIDRYDNHLPIDYLMHKTKHKNDYNIDKTTNWWIKIKFNYLIHYHYYLFMLIPPIIGIIIFGNLNN